MSLLPRIILLTLLLTGFDVTYAEVLKSDSLWYLGLVEVDGRDTVSNLFEVELGSPTEDLVLELGSPFVEWWEVRITEVSGKHIGNWVGGTQFDFRERPMETRSFSIPFKVSELPLVKLQIETRMFNAGSRDKVLVRLMESDEFERRRGRYNLLLSTYFGVMAFMLIYGFIILAVVGAKIRWSFLYYFAIGGLLVATMKGLTFEFLWPGIPEIHKISKPFLINASFIGSFRFLQVFFRTARRLPRLNRAIWVIMVLHALLAASSMLFPLLSQGQLIAYSHLNDLLFLIAETVFVLTPILHFTRTKSREAPWIMMAYSIHSVGVLIGILHGIGLITMSALDFTTFDWLIWFGILWMNMVLTFVILFRIRSIMEKQERDARALERERRRRFRELVIQEEMERGRIGADLHDDAGSRLASIKMSLSGLAFDEQNESRKNAFDDVITDVDQICEVNRQLSHQLLSVSLEKLGPLQALQEYQKRLLRRGRYVALLHDDDLFDQLDETLGTLVYRIVIELVENIYSQVPAFRIQFEEIRAGRELCLVAEALDEDLPAIDHESDAFRSLKTRVALFHEERIDPVVRTPEGVRVWVPLN